MAWISLGLAIGCTLLFIVYQFVDGAIVSTYLSSGVRAIVMQRWVDLVAGVLLLLAAGLLSWRARRGPTAPRPKPDRRHRPDDSSPRTAAALGFANAFMGSSGFATMYVVARVVSVVGPDLALRALVYLTFIPTLVGPYLILAWSWNRWPDGRLDHPRVRPRGASRLPQAADHRSGGRRGAVHRIGHQGLRGSSPDDKEAVAPAREPTPHCCSRSGRATISWLRALR